MFKHQVYAGLTTWAAWGDTGWRCVRVLSVGRRFAKVQREDPKTGEVIARKGKALIAEMVYRDVRKRGQDKPSAPPAVVFREQRVEAAREPERALEPEAPPQREPAPPRVPLTAEGLSRLNAIFDAMRDCPTDSDW